MRIKHLLVFALIFALILPSVLVIPANASSFAEDTEFEYVLTKVDAEKNPGNVKAELSIKTDPGKRITTFGATIVLNTDYFDLVDKKGNVVTGTYQTDVKVLENNMPLYAVPVGEDEEKFSSVKGLSIASYNAQNKEMYLFICGMAISGIPITEKSQVAYFFFKSKTDKAPDGAIRLMKESEAGTACKSQAVMVTQIGCTTEVGDGSSKVTLDVDEALMKKSETPTTTEPATEPATEPTTKEAQTDPATEPSEENTVTTQPEQETTTQAVEEMSEGEIVKEIEQKIAIHDNLVVTEEQKQSAPFKAYEKAVEKAKKVLSDEDATKEEKAEVLKELRQAQEDLKESVPEVGKQIDKAEKEMEASSKPTPWLFIGIGGAVAVTAAVIIVLIIKNKNKKK